MGLWKRGNTYYSKIRFPSHPHADKDGKLRIPLDTDKGRAIIALGRLIEQRNAKKFNRAPIGSTYLELKDRVLRHASGKAKNTLEQYKRAFANLEAFQSVQSVTQITPDFLMGLYTYWKARETPRGLYVRNRDIQSLKASMRLAEDWGMVERGQNWKAVKRDKEPKGRLLWYTPKTLKIIFKACSGAWLTVAMLGSRAGLRRSEIHWLGWEDVDFARKRLHVSPNPAWAPKDHEMRWIPMSPDLVAYLKKLPRTTPWVLGKGRTDPGTMTNMFRRILRGIGLKGSIHTLRHTYISHLMSAGAPPKWVQEVAGHSKIEMTMRYAHLSPEAQQNVSGFLPKIG